MRRPETVESVTRSARERLYPSLSNPSYLVLDRRREIFSNWLREWEGSDLRVLDVGGRIQPYRTLLAGRVRQYVAVDVLDSPLVNVRASATALPFASDVFDLVVCTQVLEYLPEPVAAAREIHRVLKRGGIALLSFAAFYPRAVDEEHWRFLPPGIRLILHAFPDVEIIPEGSSISGFFRACAVCLSMFARYQVPRFAVNHTLVPVLNLAGKLLDSIVRTNNDQATGNYSVLARK
jgi:SAM-dependent methyltransferase